MNWLDYDKLFPSHRMVFINNQATCEKCNKTFDEMSVQCVKAQEVKDPNILERFHFFILSIKRKFYHESKSC